MTTPSGQISMSDVRLEIYGSSTGQIDMQDPNVYYLAGKSSGAISMSDLKSKTYVRFTPDGSGTYSDTKVWPTNASITISCNHAATWSYIHSGDSSSTASLANNASGTSITFTLATTQFGGTKTASWAVTATSFSQTRTYTINLEADSLN